METSNLATGQETPQEMVARLGVTFHDNLLLNRALTHRSFLNEHPEAIEDNERLEFLGDAVLDFVVGAWLYNQFPEMAEGDLTRMRSALVHTGQLAAFARQIRLGNVMRLGKGELSSGGNNRSALLCDTFEAFIGAIYLDSGIDAVLHFIGPILEDASDDILINDKINDPKSRFQEWAQAQGHATPQYITRKATGPDHSKVFEVDVVVDDLIYGSGSGHSKQAATKAAAIDAIKRIDIVP